MAEKDTARTQIVAAAKKRFSHFGYAKTTMAEVASDCDMSPGNLYRFFPGKLDIAEVIAIADHQTHLEYLRRQAAKAGRDARHTLRDFLFDELRRTYARLDKDPRSSELARVIAAERPGFHDELVAREIHVLGSVLERGVENGEFVIEDCAEAARMLRAATLKFRYPQLWSRRTLPELERELDGVLGLLLKGICPAREAALA